MLTPPDCSMWVALSPEHCKLLFRYVTEQIRHCRVPAPSGIFSGKRAQTATRPRQPSRQRLPIPGCGNRGHLPLRAGGSSKDLSRSDSCFDPWINFPASAIKRTVFLFSFSILHCDNEESSSILRRNNATTKTLLHVATCGCPACC